MATIGTEKVDRAQAVLAASGRAPEIPESADVYGWFVGSWELEIDRYAGVDVRARRLRAEVHAGWALEGRAVQDVWIMPPRSARGPEPEERGINMFGTTLRVWDPTIQAWRITWINPVHNHREEQIGRRIGAEIVQIGARANGVPTRWRFTELTRDSFRWIGEALTADGKTWNVEGDFRARRTG
jgi:hypothetical protein